MLPVIGAMAAGIAGSLGLQFGRLFTIEAVKFLAWRAFILFIVFVALPVVLYNTFSTLLFDLMNMAVTYVSDGNYQPLTINLTGLAGYLGNQIGLPNMVSIYLTAISTKFTMGFIPFIRI
ncbi:MAG: hypothetical protein JRE14_16665 [Deltaproteobacteria bacterium]|nr:hypothetical protein [Deltaproteobacteria bacterium]